MQIRFLRQAHKFIKRSSTPLKAKIRDEIDKIIEDPHNNPKLKSKFNNLYSHHFIFMKVAYRIVYYIENGEVVIVVAIGTRENFYRGF